MALRLKRNKVATAVSLALAVTGGNTLAVATFLQRVNTEGGLAPSVGCDALPDVGKKAFIAYSADYIFYKKN